MRAFILTLLVTTPVVAYHVCGGEPVYDEGATCVKICTEQLRKKVWAVKPISYPVTQKERERVPQSRVCACYTERVVVLDGVTSTEDLPPEVVE